MYFSMSTLVTLKGKPTFTARRFHNGGYDYTEDTLKNPFIKAKK
jgi:hypothetical protein